MAIDAGSVVMNVVPSAASFGGLLKKQIAGAGLAKIGLAAGAAVGAALAVGAVAAFKVGERFDEAFDTIRVGTGATGKALDGLKGDFRAVFGSVPTDMKSASTAIADLNTRLGLTGKPLQAVSRRALELSRITGEDLNQVIESSSRVFGDWGIKAQQMPGHMDKLFRASQATGIPVEKLSRQLVQFGAPLRQLGFDFDTSAGLLGKFEKEGVNAELVMGSMRIALGKMARDGEPAKETLQRVTEEIKNAGSESEANALALELFGARAGPDMAAAIREGRFELGDLLGTIKDGDETILGAAKATRSWRESWQVIVNKGLLLFEPVANRVFGGVSDFFAWLVDTAIPAAARFTTGFRKAADALRNGIDGGGIRRFAEILDKLVGGQGRFVGFFTTIGEAITTIVARFNAGADNVGPDGPLGRAFAAIQQFVRQIFPPIVATVTSGVDAVVAVFRGVGNFLGGVWARVGARLIAVTKSFLGAVAQTIRGGIDIFRGVFDVIGGIFTGDWSKMWGGIQKITSGAWNVLQGLFRAGWQAITAVVRVGVAAVQTLFSGFWTRLKKAFISAMQALGRTISAGWQAITRTTRSAFTAVQRFIGQTLARTRREWDRQWEQIRRFLAGIWTAITRATRSTWEAIRRFLTSVINRITSFFKTVWNRNVAFYRGIGQSLVRLTSSAWQSIWRSITNFAGRIRSTVSSMLDRVKGFFSNAWQAVQRRFSLFRNSLVFAVIGLRRLVLNAFTAFRDKMFNLGKGIFTKLADGIRAAISKVKSAVGGVVSAFGGLGDGLGFVGPPAVYGGASTSGLMPHLKAAAGRVAQFGLGVTSGFRPGSITSTGNRSYHGKGRAIDLGPPSMAKFNLVRAAYPNATELIYTPAGGRQLWHGQNHVFGGGSIRADHYDHIHLALAEGGLLRRPARSLVGENGPEILDLPRGAMVTPLDRLGGQTMSLDGAPIVLDIPELGGRITGHIRHVNATDARRQRVKERAGG